MEGRNQGNALDKWSILNEIDDRSLRDRRSCDDLVAHLDWLANNKGIENPTLMDRCDTCFDRKRGHLDESNIQYVPGYLHKKWFEPQDIQFVLNYGQPSQRLSPSTKRLITPYELRQMIVRSGVFKTKDLSNFRFTSHELEVNDASFIEVRSKHQECSCLGVAYGHYQNFGDERAVSPEFWLLDELEEHVVSQHNAEWDSYRNPEAHSKVEKAFLEGNGIRTGYRKRSSSARIARKEKRIRKASSELIVVCKPQPDPLALGTGLYSVNPEIELRLEFLYRPPKRPGRRTRRSRRVKISPEAVERMSRKDTSRKVLNKADKRLFYFNRVNGFNYPSVHHPMDGDKFRKQSEMSPAKQGLTRTRKQPLRDKWYTPPETPVP